MSNWATHPAAPITAISLRWMERRRRERNTGLLGGDTGAGEAGDAEQAHVEMETTMAGGIRIENQGPALRLAAQLDHPSHLAETRQGGHCENAGTLEIVKDSPHVGTEGASKEYDAGAAHFGKRGDMANFDGDGRSAFGAEEQAESGLIGIRAGDGDDESRLGGRMGPLDEACNAEEDVGHTILAWGLWDIARVENQRSAENNAAAQRTSAHVSLIAGKEEKLRDSRRYWNLRGNGKTANSR